MHLAVKQLVPLVPMVVAFLLSVGAYPFYINWLKKKQIGQYIREEGPQSHAVKAKTPTMGGLCFIATSTVTAGLFIGLTLFSLAKRHDASALVYKHVYEAIAVSVVGALCGLVGFADDFGKITSKSNRGMSAKSRLLIEFFLGFVLGGLIYTFSPFGGVLFVGPGQQYMIALGPHPMVNYFYLFALTPFLVAATANALNLHDGMDGLAGGTSLLVFASLAAMLIATKQVVLAVIALSIAGALVGFLCFNRYPAKVFMGDTGSLFLGGMMASLVVAGGLLVLFVPMALIYIAETLSVMAQVAYFKLTKPYTPEKPMSQPALIWLKLTKRLPGEGKRLFLMAPLHHHYEAIAEANKIPEWQVVAWFWFAQAALCAFVLAAFFGVFKQWVGG